MATTNNNTAKKANTIVSSKALTALNKAATEEGKSINATLRNYETAAKAGGENAKTAKALFAAHNYAPGKSGDARKAELQKIVNLLPLISKEGQPARAKELCTIDGRKYFGYVPQSFPAAFKCLLAKVNKGEAPKQEEVTLYNTEDAQPTYYKVFDGRPVIVESEEATKITAYLSEERSKAEREAKHTTRVNQLIKESKTPTEAEKIASKEQAGKAKESK